MLNLTRIWVVFCLLIGGYSLYEMGSDQAGYKIGRFVHALVQGANGRPMTTMDWRAQ